MEAEQQLAFYQGQATLLGVQSKSPTQHPPGCVPCLKCHCTSFPGGVRGPVLTPWDISYQTFSLMLEVLLQHKWGGHRCLAGQVRSLKTEGCLCKQEMIPSCEGWVSLATSLLCADTGRCWVQLCWQDHGQPGGALLLTLGFVPHCRKSLLLVSHV